MTARFTCVLISYRKNRRNHRLRFGLPERVVRLDWQRSLATFKPGQIFGYIRWTANQYGTQDWCLIIAQTTYSGSISPAPGIRPGAHILLQTQGASATKTALNWLDVLEECVSDLSTMSPNFWRGAHQTLLARQTPALPSSLQIRAGMTGVIR